MTDTNDLSKRHIRSFVLRQGRVSTAQQRAIDTLMPRFGIPYAPQPLDLARVFGRTAPKILEIGFGMGDSTASIAQAHPENDYLALEVHTPGVGSLLKRIAQVGLVNVRLMQHDENLPAGFPLSVKPIAITNPPLGTGNASMAEASSASAKSRTASSASC